jgi:hypothetical protein
MTFQNPFHRVMAVATWNSLGAAACATDACKGTPRLDGNLARRKER